MPFLPEVQFGAYLVYSPQGTSQTSKWTKGICSLVKQDGLGQMGAPPKVVRMIPYLVRRLSGKIADTPLTDLFADQPVLVPAPRSSPVKPDSLYPTRLICDQLVANGLGLETRILLERIAAVPKAAFSRPEDRPTLQMHYDSLRVTGELLEPRSILLVDDVVTKGTMLLASATRLQEALPRTRIRVFALIRTMSHVEIERIEEICVGKIEQRGERGVRVP
ncbi:MAG: hypothetical protein SGI92_06225 [Bryobacteraceae bacterium]|nr:hypothetical protein [Bryobacteraceae bacterium]